MVDRFVIDGVCHPYNFSPENQRGRFGRLLLSDAAIGDCYVDVAVVVEVLHDRSEASGPHAGTGDAGSGRAIEEHPAGMLPPQAMHLAS